MSPGAILERTLLRLGQRIRAKANKALFKNTWGCQIWTYTSLKPALPPLPKEPPDVSLKSHCKCSSDEWQLLLLLGIKQNKTNKKKTPHNISKALRRKGGKGASSWCHGVVRSLHPTIPFQKGKPGTLLLSFQLVFTTQREGTPGLWSHQL